MVLLNRADRADAAWEGRGDVRLPDSRMAAHVAHAGREPRGAFGERIAELADRWEWGA